nr:hypothetical protein [Propionibacteriales bacterium]
EVTVARGNLVEAHHGLVVSGPADQTLTAVEPDWADRIAPGDRLEDEVVGYLLTGATDNTLARRADGQPYRLNVNVTLPSGGVVPADVVPTHLGSPPGTLSVTVDEEPWRRPLLRFKTGGQGQQPPAGSIVDAIYEVGGGLRANVPANTLTRLERNTAPTGQPPLWTVIGGAVVRNPEAAVGGADPEPLDRVRLRAPQAFISTSERAVLPADHAAAARRLHGIDRASATREWTGAWPLIYTVVDATGDDPAADLQAGHVRLDRIRMIGQESAVDLGQAIGLLIGLEVCLTPGTEAEAVRRQILARLRPGTDEAPGLFHPDNMRLGGTIYTSAVVAAAAAISGVDAVEVVAARRLAEAETAFHRVLTFAANEIPVLDDDVARPERGRLDITLRGGR